MSRKRKSYDGGRAKREAARAAAVVAVQKKTDAIIDEHMSYLLDGDTDASQHNDRAHAVIELLVMRFKVTHDYRHARRQLASRVIEYNKAHGANLAVPPALTRSRPLPVRRSRSWCERRRQVNVAHEALMQSLDNRLSPKLGADESLGLVLYFASALGGLGDPRALSALRDALTQSPEILIHRGLGITYTWVCYESAGACNAFVDDKLVVYRPWIIPTAARIPLLGFLGAANAGATIDDDVTAWALIRHAYQAVVGQPYPRMTFRKFCRTASAVYERQDGVDVPEILVQVGNGQVECLSPPPDQWDSLLQEFAFGELTSE